MGTRSVCWVQSEAGSTTLQSKSKLAISHKQYDKFPMVKIPAVGSDRYSVSKPLFFQSIVHCHLKHSSQVFFRV